MTELVHDNVTKSSISPKYHQEKTPEQAFTERALFVFNICYDTTEEELSELFFKYGLAKVKLMMNEQTQKNQGYAFVEYMDPAHAKEAVKQLNGYQLHDTKLKVQFNTKQPPWYASNYNRRQNDNPPSNSIYVRNLDNSISSDDLEGHFKHFGPVKVSLVMDHVTKRNKGYAFVDFATVEEAANAIKQTNGVVFYGRQLHVEFSNRGSNIDRRKSESVSSLNSEDDDSNKLRLDREKMEEVLDEKKAALEEAKAAGCEDTIQTVREGIWILQDEIARIKLAEEYPQPQKSSRSRSREEKRKKKRRSDEDNQYYSDERENTPGLERPYTPTSFGRRSHHRGSISSNSSQGDDGYMEHRVFVGGINHDTTPETFKRVFSKFGKINSCFVKCDKVTGRNKGFGFLSYDTAEQMENLLATHKENPVIIDNYVVNIKRVFPDSHVSPFPLNIPPMLCRAAPHFTDPPAYCDDKNPLPDDQKIVEFFYNLGIHHYNLLRINVYHWNLLFPGNMFNGSKMDSTPPTRQPSPAPPSFPAQSLPVFAPQLDAAQHRPPPHIPPHPTMMANPIHSRTMFQSGGYPRQPLPLHEFINMPKLYNNNVNNRGNHHYNNNNNNNNNKRGMHNNYHSNNNNNNNNYHHNYHNYHTSNRTPPGGAYHGNTPNHRSPLETLQHPIRLHQPDRNIRHVDHRASITKEKQSNGPGCPQQVSFSPTNFSPTSTLARSDHTVPFSPENFSPSKVSNSPAHSSPPQQTEEGQNNSSYGSHEDTLTYESADQVQEGYPASGTYQSSLHKAPSQQGLPPPTAASLQRSTSSAAQTAALLSDLALSPTLARPVDRSRSSSGSYNEGAPEKTCPLYEKQIPQQLPPKPSHVQTQMANLLAAQQHHQQQLQSMPALHRHQAPRHQPEKLSSEQPSLPKEAMEQLQYMRNFPSTTAGFHATLPTYPDYADKGPRLADRSPHTPPAGLPPPGYNPIQWNTIGGIGFLNMISRAAAPGSMIPPGALPPQLSQANQQRYHNSPTPSEDESEDDNRQ